MKRLNKYGTIVKILQEKFLIYTLRQAPFYDEYNNWLFSSSNNLFYIIFRTNSKPRYFNESINLIVQEFGEHFEQQTFDEFYEIILNSIQKYLETN
jgi:hypothetical protein